MLNFMNRLIPFIVLGIILVIFIAGLILLSQLLILGAIVGLVLFILGWIKQTLFGKKQHKKGRVIDHDDL